MDYEKLRAQAQAFDAANGVAVANKGAANTVAPTPIKTTQQNVNPSNGLDYDKLRAQAQAYDEQRLVAEPVTAPENKAQEKSATAPVTNKASALALARAMAYTSNTMTAAQRDQAAKEVAERKAEEKTDRQPYVDYKRAARDYTYGNKSMTDAEKAAAEADLQARQNELLASGTPVGAEATADYLWRKAAGGAQAAAEGFVNFIGDNAQVQARAINRANADRFADMGLDYLAAKNAQELAESENNGIQRTVDFATRYNTETNEKYFNPKGFTKTAGNVVEGVTQMAPSIVANFVAPGVGGMFVMASQAAGNAIAEAKDAGASDDNAIAYGVSVAAVEVLTEKMFDGMAGIFGKGAMDDIVENAIKKAVQNETAQKALNALAGQLGEGFEEWVSEYADHFLNRAFVKSDTRSIKELGKDAWASFAIGGLVSGVMQVGGAGLRNLRNISPRQAAEIAADVVTQEVNASTGQNSNAQERLGSGQVNLPSESANASASQNIGVTPISHSDLVSSAIESAQNSANGTASGALIESIAGNRSALNELGIDTNGKTKSQLRAEIGDALRGTIEIDAIAQKNGKLKREDIARVYPNARQVNADATPVQAELNAVLDQVAAENGFEHGPDTQKSTSSIVSRMLRDEMNGKPGAKIKDAARGHFEMNSWDNIPGVLQSLTNAKIPYTVSAKSTDFGYKGLHLTWTQDGVGIELQLSTPEAWPIKMISEEYYAKWRDIPTDSMTKEQRAEYLKDIQDCNALWDKLDLPDFSIYETSSSDIGVPSINSPQVMPLAGIQEPSTNSSNDSTDNLNTRPSTLTNRTTETPPSNTNVSQGENVVNTPSSEAETITQSGVNNSENANPDQVGVGAAEAGFTNPDVEMEMRDSRLKDTSLAYNRVAGEAAGGLTREEYDRRFQYLSQPEAYTLKEAENLLWFDVDGERTFLADLDKEGFKELKEYLKSKAQWSAAETDTAMLIEQELRRRAYEGTGTPGGAFAEDMTAEGTPEEFNEWQNIVRQHATESGRAVQAFAKWNRSDNDSGQMTEREAAENLEKSNLSPEEKAERMRQIIRFDKDIELADTNEKLQDVILNIARERGTVKGLTGRQSKMLESLARWSIGGLDASQLKQFAYASSAALSKDATPANAGQKVKTIQVLNMLSNLRTPARNIAGNTSFYGLDAMSMRGAAVLDMALSAITGTRSTAMERFTFNNEGRKAIADAIRLSAAEVTMDVDMGASNRYGTGSNRTFKMNGTGVFNSNTGLDKLAERVLSVCERNTDYLLTTTDEGYKGAARATASATQQLIDQGKLKTQNANYAAEQAQALATYRTFQNSGKNGKAATAIQTVHDVLNIIGFGDSGRTLGSGKNAINIHAFGLGDMVAPFTRVAGNLAAIGVDYSPVNAVKGTAEILNVIRKAAAKQSVNPAQQAKAVSDFARGMTGTALAYGVLVLAKAGLIKRADDEEDKDVADLNKSEGMTGTQVNIDAINRWINGGSQQWQHGDTLMDMSSLEPINFIISLGVEMADNDNGGFLSTFTDVDSYKDTFKSAVETAGDLPILSNVGEFAKDVLVYGTGPGEAAAEMLGKTAISSATPNIVAAFAKGLDEKQRSTYSSDEVQDVLLDVLKSRIPGLRETLPTSVNTLGVEAENPGTLTQRLLNAMINPLGINEYKQSDVSKEMERVREKTGQTDFYPSTRKPDSLTWKDKAGKEHEVKLSYDDKQKFQEKAADTQLSITETILKNNGYKRANDATKAKLLKRAEQYAYQVAKGSVIGNDKMEAWVRNSQTAKKDIGVSQADYFVLYEKYGASIFADGDVYNKTKRMVGAGLTVDEWAKMRGSMDTDDNGSTSKSELTAYIEANFPKEKWSQIFDAYKGNSNWKNPY